MLEMQMNSGIGENTKKTTTIKSKIQKSILILVAVSVVLVGGVSCWLNYTSTISTLEETTQAAVLQAAEQVMQRINTTMSVVEVLGTISDLSSQAVSLEAKKEILNSHQKKYGWENLFLVDESGVNIFDQSVSVREREYFKDVMNGEVIMADPTYSLATGEYVVVIASPLWKDGVRNSTTEGAVIISVDASAYSSIMATIKVSPNATAYMINGSGDCIAHPNYSLVTSQHNSSEQGKTDSSMKKLGELETNLMNGQSGFGSYTFQGERKLLAYTPIGINGWGIAVGAPLTDFMASTIMGIVITVAMFLLAILVAIFIAKRIGSSVGNPIKMCAERLKLLSEGDLDSSIEDVNTRDETMVLVESTKSIVNSLHDIIGDTDYILAEMAENNFTVHTRIGDAAYVGSFQQLILSISKLNRTLDETLTEIQEASVQVDAGAVQMAESAQSLAEGATNQTASVEELLSTVNEVVVHVKDNTEAATGAHEKVHIVSKEAQVSQDKMNELTEAMNKIEETSHEINHIIEGIEDIASQTNLLSLNAAIEAARAGEAGRGFAVVADQIRQLADQSARSAIDTRKLIEAAIVEINHGAGITKETAIYLDKVMNGLHDITDAVEHVREASDKQELAMRTIEGGVKQISEVVENNSAAAEETSATSEELSAQSESLNALVGQFKLTRTTNM